MTGDHPPPVVATTNIQQEPNTLQARGAVLRLSQEAETEGVSVADRIALQDADLRKSMSESMLRVFGWANIVALATTVALVVLTRSISRQA